jgi:hypothetical protein
MILPPQHDKDGYWALSQTLNGNTQNFQNFLQNISNRTMPIGFLAFSDGTSVGFIEKGFQTGWIKSSTAWAIVTNYDSRKFKKPYRSR